MLTRPLPMGGLLGAWFLAGALVGGGVLAMSVGLPFVIGGLFLTALLILRSSAGPPAWLMGLAGVGAGLLAIPVLLSYDCPDCTLANPYGEGLGFIILKGGGSALVVGAAGCLLALRVRARAGRIESPRR